MAAKNVSFFHLHLVSDSTGETLITVARAAAAQYASVVPVEHVYPAVRTSKQLDRVLTSIEAEPGITLYTLLDETLVERLEAKCTELGLPCRSILGPVLRVFQAYLGTASNQKVGASDVRISRSAAWRSMRHPHTGTVLIWDTSMFPDAMPTAFASA